jgi:site-specific DNA-methyltransferase (adenine-specific)
MKAWWFKFKTVAFVWSKTHESWKDVTNMWRWTMGNVEMVLLWTKGKPKRIKNNIRQLVRAVRWEHSAKPTEVADRIVELMWDVPRIELFAREEREWWTVLWDGIDWKDLRDSIPEQINGSSIV